MILKLFNGDDYFQATGNSKCFSGGTDYGFVAEISSNGDIDDVYYFPETKALLGCWTEYLGAINYCLGTVTGGGLILIESDFRFYL